jgi:hypothetical protein
MLVALGSILEAELTMLPDNRSLQQIILDTVRSSQENTNPEIPVCYHGRMLVDSAKPAYT